MKGVPAWKLLIDRGIFPDRDTAERWIIAGKVLCRETRVDKPGQLLGADSSIRVKGHDSRYVSRGGRKLEHALSSLGLSVTGAVALDCGASTGGFSDCLLQHGASRVYAVDAGFGQLSGRLRADRRIVNLERTNLSSPKLLELEPPPSVVTLDLSYLSLGTALPIARELLHDEGLVVALVKPLFEIDDAVARRTGVITDRSAYATLLHRLADACPSMGGEPFGLTYSPIRGWRGTEEYFLAIGFGSARSRPAATRSLEEQLREAVRYWEERTAERHDEPG